MEFTTIHKNGRLENFYIKIDKEQEFEFIRPYFLVTSYENPQHGKILNLDCLFGGAVWIGRQLHGFGYAHCEDVYGELLNIIFKLHGKSLTKETVQELKNIKTHNEFLQISPEVLQELKILNDKVAYKDF